MILKKKTAISDSLQNFIVKNYSLMNFAEDTLPSIIVFIT
jgi:hypothetical protein